MEHPVRPNFRFGPPSTFFAPSTIFTPEDDDETVAPLNRDFDDATTVRPSSEIDRETIFAEPRLNQPTFDAKNNNSSRAV